MDAIQDCELEHFLTTYFTYREQVLLSHVCVRWYKLIMLCSEATIDKMLALAGRIWTNALDTGDSDTHYEIYRLLCEPEYRMIFIHPRLRDMRIYVIDRSYNYYRFVVCGSFPVTTAHIEEWRRTRDVLTTLYRKIDTELELELSPYYIIRYWSKIRRAIAPPADVSHEQWIEIFGAC